jgi:glucose-6-phosphate isomerase
MWDWVGGRTSEFSSVGLLPAALQGIDIQAMMAGAAAMDVATRRPVTFENPAALMALMWHFATDGRGAKDMVVLPYKDRLLLFSRYLQQLVMESLGKELDVEGKVVHQGISVYGNKGSTDQHAYVQQLRDGVSNFFITFIEVLKDREGAPFEVEPGVYCGRFSPRILSWHPRSPLRKTPLVPHAHPAGCVAEVRRHADRPVRARGRILRVACRHQRLQPAGR